LEGPPSFKASPLNAFEGPLHEIEATTPLDPNRELLGDPPPGARRSTSA
jgi:hypothetical protein